MNPWTPALAAAFEQDVIRPGADVVEPGDPALVIAVSLYRALLAAAPAALRDVAAPILADVEALAARVSVTIPTPGHPAIVLSPTAAADPVRRTITLLHERVHVGQIARVGRIQSGVDYLGSGELRARAEADAAAAATWMRYVLTGELPEGPAVLSDLYHLDVGDQNLAADVQASHLATIRAGLVPPLEACAEAATWLRNAFAVPDEIRARLPEAS